MAAIVRDTRPQEVILRERFAEQLERSHPRQVVPLISVFKLKMPEHRPGVVMDASIPVAARALANETHRIATDEEYAAYKQDLAERTKSLKRQEDEKKGIVHPEPAAQGQGKNSGK